MLILTEMLGFNEKKECVAQLLYIGNQKYLYIKNDVVVEKLNINANPDDLEKAIDIMNEIEGISDKVQRTFE